jgi:hypothetical protein
MTTSSSHIAVGGAPSASQTKQYTARRIFEIALTVVIAAALAGAWLAFFTFVPFDLRLR